MAVQVIDRTRAVKCGKGKQPCRYEVAIYHTEADWDSGDWALADVAAKFQCKGDAMLWAKDVAARLGGIYCVVVTN